MVKSVRVDCADYRSVEVGMKANLYNEGFDTSHAVACTQHRIPSVNFNEVRKLSVGTGERHAVLTASEPGEGRMEGIMTAWSGKPVKRHYYLYSRSVEQPFDKSISPVYIQVQY